MERVLFYLLKIKQRDNNINTKPNTCPIKRWYKQIAVKVLEIREGIMKERGCF